MSCKLGEIVVNLVKHHSNNADTKDDRESNQDDTDIDGLIAELVDEVPTSVLEDNADTIDKYIEKNDFQGLKQLLHKINIPLYVSKIHHRNKITVEKEMMDSLTKFTMIVYLHQL